jgi:hypothetical protein
VREREPRPTSWECGFLGLRAYHRLRAHHPVWMFPAAFRGGFMLGVALPGWDPSHPTLFPRCTQHPHPVFPQEGGRSTSVSSTTCFFKGRRRLFALSSGVRCPARLRSLVCSCMLDPPCGVLRRYMLDPDMMYRLLETFPPLPILRTLVAPHESAHNAPFTRFSAQISSRVLCNLGINVEPNLK